MSAISVNRNAAKSITRVRNIGISKQRMEKPHWTSSFFKVEKESKCIYSKNPNIKRNLNIIAKYEFCRKILAIESKKLEYPRKRNTQKYVQSVVIDKVREG